MMVGYRGSKNSILQRAKGIPARKVPAFAFTSQQHTQLKFRERLKIR